MENLIPPDHVDDLPVVKPNKHDDVSAIPEHVLVDEDEDPKEEEFEEEEEPQEEEDDMESEPKDVINVEDTVESEDETIPASVYEKKLEEARFSYTLLRMQNERVERDLYWTRVRAHEFYREMILRGFVFKERPNEAIDVSVEDEKSPSSEPRGSLRDS
uniref:Uncharacterized protein n=1 Tax=Tanacetum cinerariifolium TaxID=118510 RepID=A0A699HUU4_TANCI|nr:hypothetical protein [Tanacetum cinerariifolium]